MIASFKNYSRKKVIRIGQPINFTVKEGDYIFIRYSIGNGNVGKWYDIIAVKKTNNPNMFKILGCDYIDNKAQRKIQFYLDNYRNLRYRKGAFVRLATRKEIEFESQMKSNLSSSKKCT